MDFHKIVSTAVQNSSIADDDKDFYIQGFQYFIELGVQPFEDARKIPAGRSLFCGRPHLPDNIAWPAGYYFYAQLNCADLKFIDHLKYLPDTGVLYLFLDPMANDYRPVSKKAAKAFYYEGDTKELKLSALPLKSSFSDKGKYYYKDLAKSSSLMTYKPAFTFSAKPPDDLVNSLESTLGFQWINETNCSIFGKPQTWNGEDEDSLFAPSGWDRKKGSPKPSHLIMLYQDVFGEGNLHFWIDKEKLLNKNFDEIFVTGSVS